jgi:hypothetical protein
LRFYRYRLYETGRNETDESFLGSPYETLFKPEVLARAFELFHRLRESKEVQLRGKTFNSDKPRLPFVGTE